MSKDAATRIIFVNDLAMLNADQRSHLLAMESSDELAEIWTVAMREGHYDVAASVEVEGNARGQN